MTAYKFLAAGATGRFSEFAWPVPEGGAPGRWVEVEADLEDCRVGIHACRAAQVVDWLDDELWELELGGDVVERATMLIGRRGRLVRRVEAWSSETARAFADACVGRAREQALRALRRHDLTDEAQRLVAALQPEDVQREAATVAAAAPGEVAEAAGFAADAVALARGRRPDTWDLRRALADAAPDQSPAATAANLGFVVAHAAGREAVAATGDGEAYGPAFAAERAWQTAWLVERLGLDG